MKNKASIFNDVIGPVMRGPSSSHTAASWRVAKMAVQLLDDDLLSAHIEFDPAGQWATNYEEQGTVLGMNGGLLGIDMADDQMKDCGSIASKRGISITYAINSFENYHANSMLLTLIGHSGKTLQILAASLGGGSFCIQKVDGFDVTLSGDHYGLLVWVKEKITNDILNQVPGSFHVNKTQLADQYLYTIKGPVAIEPVLIGRVSHLPAVNKTAVYDPIVPIVSGLQRELPFSTIATLVKYSKENNLSLGELGLIYESHQSGLSDNLLKDKMDNLVNIIEGSIAIGLAGTNYKDRILHQQSDLIDKAERAGKILRGSIVNTIIKNVAAIMESKSALEVIVANPTAGSCGTVGAVIAAVSDNLGSTRKEVLNAYFAAGIVGAYFAMGPGFSAEEHGCQVECGASAGMAAAGIVELFGGTAEQALGAASMAIQNMIGLVCDPIADRVEAPCLGKNTSAAVNALSSATMAASGFAYLIPLDQVLDTIQRVSNQMPTCVKCTGCGGLAITPAAKRIKEQLSQ